MSTSRGDGSRLAIVVSLGEAAGCNVLLAVVQKAMHDMDIDIAEPLMFERLWNSADDSEAQLLPQRDGARIRAHHEIELHGHIARLSRLEEAMLAHCFAYTPAMSGGGNHERGVGNVRAEVTLARSELIHAENAGILSSNKRRHAGTKPVGVTILSAGSGRKDVCIACGYDGLKNGPHRFKVGF